MCIIIIIIIMLHVRVAGVCACTLALTFILILTRTLTLTILTRNPQVATSVANAASAQAAQGRPQGRRRPAAPGRAPLEKDTETKGGNATCTACGQVPACVILCTSLSLLLHSLALLN